MSRVEAWVGQGDKPEVFINSKIQSWRRLWSPPLSACAQGGVTEIVFVLACETQRWPESIPEASFGEAGHQGQRTVIPRRGRK
jgi:hypothetical protein